MELLDAFFATLNYLANSWFGATYGYFLLIILWVIHSQQFEELSKDLQFMLAFIRCKDQAAAHTYIQHTRKHAWKTIRNDIVFSFLIALYVKTFDLFWIPAFILFCIQLGAFDRIYSSIKILRSVTQKLAQPAHSS